MKESIFNIKVKVNDEEYIYNSKNNGIIQLDDDFLCKEENVKYLLDKKYYVEDDYDEISSLVKEVNENIKNEKEMLMLTIALTEKCNFRCVYCYQEHNPKTLNIENGEKLVEIVKEMIDENKFKNLVIHYFGGEPLLNLDMLYFLDDKFKEFVEEYNINYKAYLTTNGSMLNKDILSRVNFKSIQLTFDGLEDIHNSLRRCPTFKFKDTINLISDILEFCDTVKIRYNICEENKKDLIPFVDFILNKFEPNRINFAIARTIKFDERDKFNMISFDEYSRLTLKVQTKVREHGGKIDLPKSLKYTCPFTNGNAMTISPNLTVQNCEESSTSIGELSKNTINNKKEYSIPEECTKCKILPLCLGGCNKNRELGYKSCLPEKNIIEDEIANYIKFEI